MVGTPPKSPPRCEQLPSLGKGKGLFVKVGKRYEAFEEILEIKGTLLVGDTAIYRYQRRFPTNDKMIELGDQRERIVIAGTKAGGLWRFANHACCQSNMHVQWKGTKAFLIASTDIEEGEELLWDYGYRWSITDMNDETMKWMQNWYCIVCESAPGVPIPLLPIGPILIGVIMAAPDVPIPLLPIGPIAIGVVMAASSPGSTYESAVDLTA